MAKNGRPVDNVYLDPVTKGKVYTNNGVDDEPQYDPAINAAPPLPPSRAPTTLNLYESVSMRHGKSSLNNEKPVPTIRSEKQTAKSRTRKLPTREVILGICCVILLSVILVETTILLVKQKIGTTVTWDEELYRNTSTEMPITRPIRPPTSCLDLKYRGYSNSGFYSISVFGSSAEYQVFCDMATDGGGWTLVASVHEDDITRKCDNNDRWSAYAATDSCNREYSAWDNKLTFGDLRNATSDDYKNPGYQELRAEDVMIWHVTSNTPLELARNKSTLRYRTTNNFLQRFGGSLYTLFNEYYKLNIRRRYKDFAESEMKKRPGRVIDALEKHNATIKSHIPNWYSYEQNYGGSTTYIFDDGLYDYYGNRIFIDIGVPASVIQYGDEYWLYDGSYFSILAKESYPFMMATVIGNEELEDIYFQTEVYATHHPSLSDYSYESNSIEFGNYKIIYHSMQYITKDSTTAGEFHYVITNKKDWRSIEPEEFYNDTYVYSSYRNTYTYIKGRPTNIVTGYILLARKDGLPVTKEMLDDVAISVVTSITEVPPNFFYEYVGSDGLVIPIVFDKGTKDIMVEMIPEKLRPHVEGGYLQLRAYNQSGFPNVLCPGVKVDTFLPEYVCIGGISNNVDEDSGTCGDFAGWKGKRDTFGQNGRSEYSHSEDDINSVILIFYR